MTRSVDLLTEVQQRYGGCIPLKYSTEWFALELAAECHRLRAENARLDAQNLNLLAEVGQGARAAKELERENATLRRVVDAKAMTGGREVLPIVTPRR